LRRTQRPVLAVPLVNAPTFIFDGGGPRFNMTSMLMATDFSEAAGDAALWAADLAREMSVPLVLAHVVTPADVPPQWLSYVGGADAGRASLARERLEELAAHLPGTTGCDTVVAVGRPADAIASIAQDRRAGLIVVGLSGEHGLLAPRPGSIAYRVLCLAQVPVLVVPRPRAT